MFGLSVSALTYNTSSSHGWPVKSMSVGAHDSSLLSAHWWLTASRYHDDHQVVIADPPDAWRMARCEDTGITWKVITTGTWRNEHNSVSSYD